MENCCYGESELTVLRMVRDGLFGELLHGDAAYLHDLRAILNENKSEGLWRRKPHTERNGNFYTTHGLGPVAQYMGVHRGDRFDYMVSMSTPERGLSLYREATVTDRNDPRWKENYIAGDLNSSLIKTVKGRTILLQHDVVNPRPYSRLNGVQGTKGIFNDYPPRVYVEGTKGGERWTPLADFKNDYAHPLWVNVGELAKKWAGMAAWTSSCVIASFSACGKDWLPTSTCTTPQRGAHRGPSANGLWQRAVLRRNFRTLRVAHGIHFHR